MRQHYMDLYKRPIDWQDKLVMTTAGAVGFIWLCWIVEGLMY